MSEFRPLIDSGGNETLSRQGFVIIPDFLAEADVCLLEDEMGRLLAVPPAAGGYYVALDNDGFPLVANGLDRASDLMFDFARSQEMIEAGRAMLGLECMPLHVEFFAKPPNTLYQSPAHQDHAFYRDHFDVWAVAFWIALDDVDASNGGLQYANVVPDRLLQHQSSSSLDFDFELVDASMFRFEPINLRRGDCVVHHSLAVHCSAANRSSRTRRALAFNYRASPYRHWLTTRVDGP